MTSGDGCKVRPKSQGENQHGAKQIDRVALPSAGLARRSFLEVLSKKHFRTLRKAISRIPELP